MAFWQHGKTGITPVFIPGIICDPFAHVKNAKEQSLDYADDADYTVGIGELKKLIGARNRT